MDWQRQYQDAVKRDREERFKEGSIAGMKKYASGIHVGDYVYAKCDGPGPTRGYVQSITETSITICKDGYNNDFGLVEIAGIYLRSDIEKLDSYADMLKSASALISGTWVDKEICVSTLFGDHIGVLKVLDTDKAILDEGNTSFTCISLITVTSARCNKGGLSHLLKDAEG